ncbi:putative pectinesterase 53 [Hibiscus syriacus]|uniref:Pectinesterase n=1 Tax=Hibiscus syriacus TaxID=106335 RepID=A0A6A3CI90_HIBSY|nr:putative pectinesterase 53 [Hibiscus syriacus]
MAPAYSNYACIFISTLFMFMLASSRADAAAATSTAILINVDQSGNGDYKKIQDAIDAVPSNNNELVFILVKPGVYNEKIVVPVDKPFITISGSKPNEVIITWNDSGNIFESPTVTVLASDFVARYLTIQNTFGPGAKAVALRVSGDRASFFGCRMLSYQDTLLDDTGRHYYKNCYIEGAVDFIFGNAASLYEKCHLHSLSEGDAAITAQRRESPSENTGFTFLGCKITGVRTAVLGRPWGAYSRVVFAFTYMSNVILPQGWDDWGDLSKQSTVFYREYKCYGPGANARKGLNGRES